MKSSRHGGASRQDCHVHSPYQQVRLSSLVLIALALVLTACGTSGGPALAQGNQEDRENLTGNQVELLPPDSEPYSFFGSDVAHDGESGIIGALGKIGRASCRERV